ncbi:MAG: NGG1p interacting factor NIF3 [Candidatus Nomurabacteria bacterium]|nr:MAG: NGG1p interacting factor NIF3 [Candidatus Nomurabacteria bacterium]
MTIQEIYDLAIRLAIKNDLRGEKHVRHKLKRAKERYEKMSGDAKKFYDKEQLENPYSDTRSYALEPNRQVKRILAGIDVEEGEILAANELSKEKPIDLVISHHPIGHALAGLHEVMHMQAEILALYGIPINVAESVLSVRVNEVSRKLNPVNHSQVVDIARLLKVNVMCLHTATDNLVANHMFSLVKRNEKKLETVGDVMDMLFEEYPEYAEAKKIKAGPMLFAGSRDRLAGKIAVTEVTGGTEGNPKIYEKAAQAGIGTIIGMHMSEEHKKEAEKNHINAIIAGHMSSDSIGLNLFLDELEKRGVEVIPFGGLIRVRHYTPRKKRVATTRRRKK